MVGCYLNNTELSSKTENVIYALLEPKTNEIRYIGKAKNLVIRLRKHVQSSKLKEKTHKNNWVKSLLKSGEIFVSIVIDSALTDDELNEKEIKWISHYKTIGCRLTNATTGGDGGKLSPESILKMKETRKKNPPKPHWLGKKFEKEHCENLSKSKKGYVTSKETKEKLSQSHKGLNTWSKNRKASEETKIKMSKSRTGKVKNDKAVYQLGLNNEIIKLWDAPYFAEKELKLSRSKIDSVCKGKRKTTGGFVWVYVEDYGKIKYV
jgi:group I intron endonuclease